MLGHADINADIATARAPTDPAGAEIVATPSHHPLDASGHALLWFAISGALRCRTERSLHVVPPSLALWVPPGLPNVVSIVGDARLRVLAVSASTARLLPGNWAACRAVRVSALLRALAASTAPARNAWQAQACAQNHREQLIAALVVEELSRAVPAALGVALPAKGRLRQACETVLADGALACSLPALAGRVGTSARTLSRSFQKDVGLSFAEWRSQARLAHAVELWTQGHSIAAIASTLGYANASAFSAMVKRVLGMPPRRFLAA